MSLRAFANTVFDSLPMRASFTDPNFAGRHLDRCQPGSLGDFSASFKQNGLFIKVHPELAYRNGRTGKEEAVIRYEPSAEVIYINDGSLNGERVVDDLQMELLSKIMEIGPAGTPTQLLLDAFESYDRIQLQIAITRLTNKPKPQYQPRLARRDGPQIRLTSDGIRLALSEGYRYAPDRQFV